MGHLEVACSLSKDEEDRRIQSLINIPAIDMSWHCQWKDGFGTGSMPPNKGGLPSTRAWAKWIRGVTPPSNYVCHRCNSSGHFIKHCPINGDPAYDKKIVKLPTGFPKSMLVANADGSYALPHGEVAVMKPDEAAFEREIQGLALPCKRSVPDLPPELFCPLCKEVMRSAAFTSKCCFRSFCDRCIRDYLIAKSVCLCGATDVLADDLLPNVTVRNTINRMLLGSQSCSSVSSEILSRSNSDQVQDMESRCAATPKNLSPDLSAASKKRKAARFPGEATEDGSLNVKNPASQESALQADVKLQQNVAGEACKKRRMNNVSLAFNGAQQRTFYGLPAENCTMPLPPVGPAAFYPQRQRGQPGMLSFTLPYYGTSTPHSSSYGVGNQALMGW